jgi:UDP-N-acetylglucosamine 2-epimerase (non-hydrolysing)
VDRDLVVGTPDQTPNEIVRRVLEGLEPIILAWGPDAILVQGDTSTALAGALAGFHAGVPVGHVEAGLRSDDLMSPFPEEMNRRLISRLASFHFAATSHNLETLLEEGVSRDWIVLTGNPVVDSVNWAMERMEVSPRLGEIISQVGERKILLLTTHRRESFGEAMEERMRVLGEFVDQHPDVALVFPVHPNPEVQERAKRLLGEREGVFLVPPLGYADFIHLLANSWLIVSDSGGIQEETPSLGRPLLLIRENTERPEAIESGLVRLVTDPGSALREALEGALEESGWMRDLKAIPNPFGQGDAGEKIGDALMQLLAEKDAERTRGSGSS